MNLRGEVEIDPATMDFFKAVIERRQELPDKNGRLGLFLKIMANAGSYGIWAQFDRREIPGKERVMIADGSRAPWELDTSAPEEPGDYCFPPLAANITAGTRLQLAIYERLVNDLGSTWAMTTPTRAQPSQTNAAASYRAPAAHIWTEPAASA